MRIAPRVLALVAAALFLAGCGSSETPSREGTVFDGGFVPDASGGDLGLSDAGPSPTDLGADSGGGADDLGTEEPDLGAEEPDLGALCDDDVTPPELLAAFSPDGREVVLRFSEPMRWPAGATMRAEGSGGDRVQLGEVRADGSLLRATSPEDVLYDPQQTYEVVVEGVSDRCGVLTEQARLSMPLKHTLYVALLWYTFQTDHRTPGQPRQTSPWPRRRATKDDLDLALLHAKYLEVHASAVMAPALLRQQLQVLAELDPYVPEGGRRFDVERFVAERAGQVDLLLELLARPTPESMQELTAAEQVLLLDGAWTLFSSSNGFRRFFPDVSATQQSPVRELERAQLLPAKLLAELTYFDPELLASPTLLPHGETLDLTDLVQRDDDGLFHLTRPVEEEHAARLLAEMVHALRGLVPAWRQVAWDPELRTGSVELWTSASHGGLLPVLADSSLGDSWDPWTQEARHIDYPFPEDAVAQIQDGQRFHEQVFGRAPAGFWSPEVGMSRGLADLLAAEGLRYSAVLASALVHDEERQAPRGLARVSPEEGSEGQAPFVLASFDYSLLDSVSFGHRREPGAEGAAAALSQLRDLAPAMGESERIVLLPVCAQCWETYSEHDGKPYLHALLQGLAAEQPSGTMTTVTLSELLDGNPERVVPPHALEALREARTIQPGSWNDGTFTSWVAPDVSRCRWRRLASARQRLEDAGVERAEVVIGAAPLGDDRLSLVQRAWDSLLAAQNAEHFWDLYGDAPVHYRSHHHLWRFEGHLQTLHDALDALAALGEEVPPAPYERACIEPLADDLISRFSAAPVMDGRYTPDPGEWLLEGGSVGDDDGGEAGGVDLVRQLHWGYDPEALFLALRLSEEGEERLAADGLTLYLWASQRHLVDEEGTVEDAPALPVLWQGEELGFERGAARLVRVRFSAGHAGAVTTELRVANVDGSWCLEESAGVTAVRPHPLDGILELRLPWRDLAHRALTDPISVFVAVEVADGVGDRVPGSEPLVVVPDPTGLLEVTFEVDMTGERLPLDGAADAGFVPPPPEGDGTVYIVGDVAELGAWEPTATIMNDEGRDGDRLAADGIWSYGVRLQPEARVEYKYRSARAGPQGDWSGGEVPLAYRGVVLPAAEACGRVIVRDVFGDVQWGAEGLPGALTEVVCAE